MKLAFFNEFRLGVIRDGQIVDATDSFEGREFRRPQDMMEELITGWDSQKTKIESAIHNKDGVSLESVRLRAPVPRPAKLICAAVNYLATVFHHEPELALVIGKTATKVSQEDAMSHIFGYCNFLDMSARGLPGAVGNSFFLGKCWDTFAPMGPALVTADEIPDPHDLQIRLWNNGEARHDFPTSDMAHKIPELISEFSKITTLEPGDVIATGVNHQQIGAVQDGDVIRMEVKELGPSLIIRISDPSHREWPRGIDKEMAERVLGRAPRG